MGSKPPAAFDERISKDRRHDLKAASRLSTTTSPLQGRAGGSAIMPKLVELVFGPDSTRRAEKLFPCIACTVVVASSVRSRVLVIAGPSSSMARRCCRASCSWLSNCFLKSLLSSSICLSNFSDKTLCSSSHVWVGQTRIFLAGGRGNCPRGQPRSPPLAC